MAFGGHVTIADTAPIPAGSSGASVYSLLSGTGGHPMGFGDTVTTTPIYPSGISIVEPLTAVASSDTPITVAVANFVTPGVYNIPFDWLDDTNNANFGSGSFNVNVTLPAGPMADITADSSVTADLLFLLSSAMVSDSSVAASLNFNLYAALTAGSSATTAATAKYGARATLPAASSLVAPLLKALTATSGGTTITLVFGGPARIDGVIDPRNYTVVPCHAAPGFPITITGVTPIVTPVQNGTAGTVLTAHSVHLDGVFGARDVGSYLAFSSPANTISYVRIISVTNPTTVVVDKPLVVTDRLNGSIHWAETTVTGAVLTTSVQTDGGCYHVTLSNLFDFTGAPYVPSASFNGVIGKPRVLSASPLDEGQVIVSFSQAMLQDQFLTDPDEYTITGPTAVEIDLVQSVGRTQVALYTKGMVAGSYTLTVNATGTPHDIAGNPIDPAFNAVIFTSSPPITPRSIFTDKGPLCKPPLVVQSGTGVAFDTAVYPNTNFSKVTLTGANLSPTAVGLSLTLAGSTVNSGTYYITAVLSSTTVRVNASFAIPDTHIATTTWKVFDPRDGEIADDPADVTVTINSIPVTPMAVVGLLGQIVLSAPPTHGQTVEVAYHYMQNPTVDMRRLNSKEFRFNSWNRDVGFPTDPGRHKYRYNNTLVVPGSYVALDMRGSLAQPLQRDLKYRAYERAYTALLNDPHTLLFNSPTGHIAFPPLARSVAATFVNYQATVLPENAPLNPWTRHGSGTATIVNNELIIQDTSTGPSPSGQALFWTSPIDLTFPNVFASAWRMTLNQDPTKEGVFTGVASGYSDGERCFVVGYLDDGGVRKLGILLAGSGNDPSLITAWAGGIDTNGNPTGAPIVFDWSVIHSYRLFTDPSGNIRVYIDGSVVASLRLTQAQLPFLSELNEPFNQLQGVFFGSLSRPALNTSTWDFLRYNIQPLNPAQTAPSVFVSYEGDRLAEAAAQPWTPIGSHGTETIKNGLLLDSTSATNAATESLVGLVGGDFKGFTRIEPLLGVASNVALDVNVQLRTFTHGIAPNAVMAAVDDGSLLVQLCFFPDEGVPLLSYGGRTFPDQFVPYTWTAHTLTATPPVPTMVGQVLRITDTTTTDGLVYFIDDTQASGSEARTVDATSDYILEFRARVDAFVADGQGFVGVTADIFDGVRDVGVLLQTVAGVPNVTFHSDGVLLTAFPFNWNDGNFHTYRAAKSTTGNLVTLFVDTVLVGTLAYSGFNPAAGGPNGMVSFGSSTPASAQSTSTVDWAYCNAWRVNPVAHKYVGIWKGTDPNALTGYHLPTKTTGLEANVNGNALQDGSVDFIAAGVIVGDVLIIDNGSNKGVYPIASVAQHTLTIPIAQYPTGFPTQPSLVSYRIPSEVDWTTSHRYRIVRDPAGGVALFLDAQVRPLIELGYNNINLPSSLVGLPIAISGGLPSVTWGAIDPTELSQTLWSFVRYGIVRPRNELALVPPHQILNQRNVIASYERHLTNIPHTLTDFWSESEGIPPQTSPDLLQNPGMVAYTLLNEGTPLVPLTQSYEVRRPTPMLVPVVGFNNPQDLLNSQAFIMNESEQRIELLVPPDVLYDSLTVIETDTGSPNLLTPFFDNTTETSLGTLFFQKTTCLDYDAATLPESDPSAATPWIFQADDASHVTRSVFSNTLTFGTDGTGTRAIYRNSTPLPDATSMQTQVTFRLKVLNDSTGGLGDTQIRYGFSATGMTLSLGLVTNLLGERYVLVFDQNSGLVVGGRRFNFDDGAVHTYRIVRDPSAGNVSIFIDS